MPRTQDTTKLVSSTPGPEAGPVLVGYDGSEGGRDALALARVLSSAEQARCLVGTCLTDGPVPVRTGLSDLEDPEVSALFEEARASLGDLEVETHVIGNRSPARMLVEFAEREDAGTLVVGSPHRGKIGRALLGSVAEHVLHHAPCEVVIAPRGYAAQPHTGLAKVGVAFDGTPEAQTALRRAEEIARSSGASIEIIVAEDVVVSGVKDAMSSRSLNAAPGVLKSALESVDPSIEAEGKVLDPGWRQIVREVARAIADTCSDDVDLLVLGTRPGTNRFFYGSVSKCLIDTAPCPVLVVPRAE